MMFGHRLLMTPIASWIGFGAMVYGGWALATGAASLLWLIPMLIGVFFMQMGVTVGLHRLFCHAAFETSKFWTVVLGVLGTLGIYGSTVQWASMHMSHHEFADTPQDPHYTGWRYLFWKKNNPTTFNRRVLSRLWRNPLHRFLHKYYALVVLSVASILALVGTHALVFVYLIPLGWLHLVGSAHQVFAHGSDGALDKPNMEFWLFTGGEWLHKHHHEYPKDIRFGHYDLGYRFIQVIQK